MANAWKRERSSPLLSLRTFLLASPVFLLLLLFLFFSSPFSSPPAYSAALVAPTAVPGFPTPIPPFDCDRCPQASPVFASLVEGVKRPFFYSLADLGSLPEKPHKNIARMLKGKPFRKPDISVAIQNVLEKKREREGLVVDVGANVGMAAFAAAAMGFKVLAFEPVFENLQRICDGLFLNRAWDRVSVFAAAASDHKGNITFHKLVGRLDNSAVSATGAKLAFKSNEEISMEVASIPLDDVIPDSERVVLLKIDVQGWEYHVLRGAKKLLSRQAGEAPYLIYEEDEQLLKASNSSSQEIHQFLESVGYHHCTQHGTDSHCTKD
ncbi:hypothetical protein Taro_019810 [Colocasia esculenta]|uniref:Methyltransferase FkbM domain-containing protein n=1 Tax=Colocasia esculenta TaxID=4460 RepID=A0A843V6L7_COLES|nr:hypothetical protein [Colocasia esculenta]